MLNIVAGKFWKMNLNFDVSVSSERLEREIRRRTRVIGAFPDDYSAMMQARARLRHILTIKL